MRDNPVMALAKSLCLFFLLHLFLPKPAESKCPESFQCGHLGTLQFPLYHNSTPGCGLFMVNDCDSGTPKIQFGDRSYWYHIMRNISTNKFLIRSPLLEEALMNWNRDECFLSTNLSLFQFSPSVSFTVSPNLTMWLCSKQDNERVAEDYFKNYNRSTNCKAFTAYYNNSNSGVETGVPSAEGSGAIPPECRMIQLPRKPNNNHSGGVLHDLLTSDFVVEWDVSKACYDCHHGGGQCLTDNMNEFHCQKGNSKKTLLVATSIVGGTVLLICSVSFLIYQRYKKLNGAYLLSRNISSNPSSKSDIEGGSFYFGIPIFSYTELEKATNSFDPSNELGDGGFGTVYFGKLKDGREVAIKRLYEHNYRRVEQFMNEIKILTTLRHPNLVSLYGCTSRRSRELLLVYEYISNGTVADHLHGERAKEAPLTWPVRMNIAIETAAALAYLHNSDIIHRDVKTNNILLDSNFSVKVADFGLSRLFPNDVTHISTAPQGTPGYVDPEYHQCYQLTDKSDVYSFGVVLIELVSSMPAVDITRHRHEINLANLAINRIQRCAFDELIDESLGFGDDAEVARMTTSVAELAFRCLQLEKDLRPSMDEVLAFLKDIQAGEDSKWKFDRKANKNIPPSPENDDAVLLKNRNFQSSPTAVTDVWVSSGSTTTSSIG